VNATKAKPSNKRKPETHTVGWRLSQPLLDKAQGEAERLGMGITHFINYLLARYFEEKGNGKR